MPPICLLWTPKFYEGLLESVPSRQSNGISSHRVGHRCLLMLTVVFLVSLQRTRLLCSRCLSLGCDAGFPRGGSPGSPRGAPPSQPRHPWCTTHNHVSLQGLVSTCFPKCPKAFQNLHNMEACTIVSDFHVLNQIIQNNNVELTITTRRVSNDASF